ncbi:hypothetical protein [Alkalicoccus chagannorensis]|uniref:hypothetical protein n=1 Tax=Alkalicoccus chagannorensis TaxID=427072 RepID=UPI0004071F99|nr:hypothetical protein [Alkalicoccus chagannorensis]
MNLVKPLLWINFIGSLGALLVYVFTYEQLDYREDFLVLVGLFAGVSAVGLLLQRKLEKEHQ